MRYFKLLLLLLSSFIFIGCFIPERRLYFSWNKPIEKTDICNYDFNIKNTNMQLIKTDRGLIFDFNDEIYYRIGADKPYNIKEYSYIVNEIISFMSNNKKSILIVEGHADTIGNNRENINLRLSERRASVIRDVIISSGIYYNRVKIFSYSDIMPKYTSNTYRNRRVDFLALKCDEELNDYMMFYSNYGVNNTSNYFEEK